jgi:type III restriction enzyme
MAMIIAWQTVNAVRRSNSKNFTRGFLVVTPGITIKDRLRVLKPNDPDSYYFGRELVPTDMLPDLERAKIVITNYHAFKLRPHFLAGLLFKINELVKISQRASKSAQH